jgi:ADP-heptose:LPS heptosyltransferase
MAQFMLQMDLIVTIDSGPAHLAGALGLPTWTLLLYSPDWRWMLGRDDSPWYPSMRLFRQERFEDWSAPAAALATAFSSFMRAEA